MKCIICGDDEVPQDTIICRTCANALRADEQAEAAIAQAQAEDEARAEWERTEVESTDEARMNDDRGEA